ncbi:MAG: DoxX family protein [Lacisediminihabitans sp.]
MTHADFELAQLLLRILLAFVFFGMGILHFLPKVARGMAAMIPPRIRRGDLLRPINLVYFTGVCEIAGAVGLLLPATRVAAALALVVFLIAVFPANAYAAKHREKFGRTAIPLWPRLVAQLVLIGLCIVTVV